MKKMLAAVMVFAVALAGVFVVIGGDEADAADLKSDTLTSVPAGGITAAGDYYVSENVTVKTAATGTVDIYIGLRKRLQ